MYINTQITIGKILLSLLLMVGLVPYVAAEESTSYRLYHESPNYAERGPAASSSYKMNEDGVAWLSYPLASSSYQVVTAPPSIAAEEEEEEEETPPPGEEAGEREEGGGHRGEGTILASIIALKQLRSTIAKGDGSLELPPEIEPPVHFKPSAPSQKEFVLDDVDLRLPDKKPIYDIAAYYPHEEQLLGPLHYFLTTDGMRKEEVQVTRYKTLPYDILALFEERSSRQRRFMVLQALGTLAIVLAFQLFMTRLPEGVLVRYRAGRIFFPFIFFWRKRKEEEEKGKKKKKTKSSFTSRRV